MDNKRIEFGEVRVGGTARMHINDCLNRNWLTMGQKVKEYEAKFARMFGYQHSTMVSSGTDADTAACLALYDLGAERGDEIICPALAFIAVATSILAAGFTPKFVDTKWDLNINEELIEQAITPKTRAIMAVNTMGKPCEMIRLREIADKHKLTLILDQCESHGAMYNSHPCGAFADLNTYSQFSAHLIFGVESGMVGTNDEALDQIIKSVRSHGRDPNSQYFNHLRYGLNFKPTDLHASVALESIDTFLDNFNLRKKYYYMLWEVCEPYIESNKIYISSEERNCDNSPHAFSLTLVDPNPAMFKVMTDTLDDYNIHWKRNFGCIPGHGAFKFMNIDPEDFPVANHCGNFGVHLPIHQYLTNEDIHREIECVKEILDIL